MIKGKKSFGKQLFGFLFDMCFAQHASLSILFSSLIFYKEIYICTEITIVVKNRIKEIQNN